MDPTLTETFLLAKILPLESFKIITIFLVTSYVVITSAVVNLVETLFIKIFN